LKDVATIVAEKCVDPRTKRPYTVSMIEKAIVGDLHFNISPNKSPKQQALEVIKQLKERNVIPISRAQMRLRVIANAGKQGKRLNEKLASHIAQIEGEEWQDGGYEMICLVDPGQFRIINETVEKELKGKGRVEVLSLNETADIDEHFA